MVMNLIALSLALAAGFLLGCLVQYRHERRQMPDHIHYRLGAETDCPDCDGTGWKRDTRTLTLGECDCHKFETVRRFSRPANDFWSNEPVRT